jgi:hypothetical protein
MEEQEQDYHVIVVERATGEPFLIERYYDQETAVTVAQNLRRYYVLEREDEEFEVQLKRRSYVSAV